MSRQEEIEKDYQAWQQTRTDLAEWDQTAIRFNQQEKSRHAPLTEIETAKTRLQAELDSPENPRRCHQPADRDTERASDPTQTDRTGNRPTGKSPRRTRSPRSPASGSTEQANRGQGRESPAEERDGCPESANRPVDRNGRRGLSPLRAAALPRRPGTPDR